MERFHEVSGELTMQAGKGITDHVAGLGDILNGYSGGRALETPEGTVEFSGEAAKQLFGQVGLDVPTMNKFKQHPDLQRAMVLAKLGEAGEEKSEKRLIARGIERGDQGTLYQAFITEDHLPVLNTQVINALRDTLPETTLVNAGRVADRKMSLRIVDEEWYHDLGSGGKALTAIVVENDERGKGGLSIRTGVTRVACWNYTLDHQPVFSHQAGFLHPNRLTDGIGTAIERLHSVAEAVSERLLSFHEVSVDDVQGMLRLMSGEMALPKYATEAAEEWWERSGAHPTLFWVVQALAFAAGEMTNRKQPQWSRREQVECQAFHMGDEFAESGTISFHECPKCHRPMNVLEDEGVLEGEYTIDDKAATV